MATICSFCQCFTQTLLRQGTFDHDHQPSLQALKNSALTCSLCNLFWHCIFLSCTHESVQAHLEGRVYGIEGEAYTGIRLSCILRPYKFCRNPYKEGNNQEVNSIWVYSGKREDVATESLGSTEVYGFLRLNPDFGSPAEKFFSAREIGQYPLSESAVAMIKRSVARCEADHKCGYALETALPTRVISLRPMQEGKSPMLIETDGAHGRYIALSYCWGRNQTYKTTADRLNEFTTQGIDYDKISKTAQQAIQIALILGIHYIWIDAFCILQVGGDGDVSIAIEDFAREGLQMASYYGNANITIIAASSSDSNAGFLDPRPEYPVPPFPLDFALPSNSEVPAGKLYATLRSKYNLGPIEQRAWTLQEDALSPRALIFGISQNAYRCMEGVLWEDGSTSATSAVSNSSKSIPQISMDSNATLRSWYTTLQKYSRRSRGVPQDKLTAISGVAQSSWKQIGGEYVFGLWIQDRVRGLLWRHGYVVGDTSPRKPLERILEFEAPSWSWARFDGPIVCPFTAARQEKDAMGQEKLKAEVRLESRETAHHFDPVRAKLSLKRFRLHVQGVIKPVVCSRSPIDENFVYFAKKGDHRRVIPQLFRMKDKMTTLIPPGHEKLQESLDGVGKIAVAAALPDTELEIGTHCWGLRLLEKHGLLLQKSSNGEFIRLGVFVVADTAWFDDGEPQTVMLI